MKYVEDLLGWCKNSAPILNINKTKELVISHTSACIDRVTQLRLSIILNILAHLLTVKLALRITLIIFKKMHATYIPIIWRIGRFGVSQNTLEIAYKSLVERVLTCNLTSWYKHQKYSLASVTNIASKTIGRPQSKLGEVYASRCAGKAKCVLKDPCNSTSV